ncbi:hypothetical protein TWF225_007622 [Orbilia oligospora]|uniref:Uncharacterized protein n=1 Tax=Orbilia oligospora TaxID=2813651 RepID=A0A7C8K1F8_ORBOL|nr:hypothetical protein TWF751_001559 [Orbilia oligospora]KAF3179429.1 hypothetical protein TWF225_007622 [Orbilia oligospora]KAF3253100.1 hypothetical protein TWF128_006544 [Orbilia oligospora]KAF3266958.1 hypothetical protein TWF217_001038 [Orbilia oligospora]KAF3292136.1 hypothetical protein TWF132_005815 [Orbilia oligospora]
MIEEFDSDSRGEELGVTLYPVKALNKYQRKRSICASKSLPFGHWSEVWIEFAYSLQNSRAQISRCKLPKPTTKARGTNSMVPENVYFKAMAGFVDVDIARIQKAARWAR